MDSLAALPSGTFRQTAQEPGPETRWLDGL